MAWCKMRRRGDRLVCDNCGRSASLAATRLKAKCLAETPGLGDIVAAGLESVGITKERVSQALGRPCNCGARQAALNRLGRILGIGGKPENPG